MNQNLPVSQTFAEGVLRIRSASPVSRFLGFLGVMLGFDIGRQLGESMRLPSGNQIRKYCADTAAIVDVVENETIEGNPRTFKIRVVEAVLTEGEVPIRDLHVIGEAVTEDQLVVATAQAEVFVRGWNQAYQELRALSRADCRQVNLVIERALEEYRAKFEAEQAQAEPQTDLPPVLTPVAQN